MELEKRLIEFSGGQWDLLAARTASRVTRLDLAADIVGGDGSRFTVRTPTATKLVQYRNEDGALETQYGALTTTLNDKPKFGKILYRAYDKRKQLLEMGQTPPFGDSPIYRVEWVRRWTAAAPSLDSLPTLDNPFEALTVCYVPKASNLDGWEDFVTLRLHYDAHQTAARLGYPSPLLTALDVVSERVVQRLS